MGGCTGGPRRRKAAALQSAPIVSIVIPAYNDAPTLERAVTSCLEQTLPQVEVLIVNDASADGTVAVMDSMRERDARVRGLSHAQNLQALEARRNGLVRARGEYVLFLDADDWYDKDVCARAVAVARETGADIVQFPIVPEYPFGRPDSATVEGRARMYAASDLEASGIDILHATYRDNRVVWSICGKLFSRELALAAFEKIPSQRMFQCEDAYIYFVICSLARHLACRSDLPAYHYSMGTGDTRADRQGLTAEEFDGICKNAIAAEKVGEYLEGLANADALRDDYEQLRFRLLADPTARFPGDVAPDARAAAFDALVSRWPAWEAVGWLAARHWDDPVPVARAVVGATSLRLHADEAREEKADGAREHVFAYMGAAASLDEADAFLRDAVGECLARGCEVTLVSDAPASPEVPGVCELAMLPDARLTAGGRYPERARVLADALAARPSSRMLYGRASGEYLLWDVLVIQCSGVPCDLVVAQGPETAFLGEDALQRTGQLAGARLYDRVVCSSEGAASLWASLSRSVWMPTRPGWELERRGVADVACDDAIDQVLESFMSLAERIDGERRDTSARLGRLTQGNANLEQALSGAREDAARLEGELASLRSSKAYRFGSTLACPVRALRDMLRRGHSSEPSGAPAGGHGGPDGAGRA